MDPLDEEDTAGRGRGSKGLQRTLKLEEKQADNGTEDTDYQTNSEDEQTEICDASAKTDGNGNRASLLAKMNNKPVNVKRNGKTVKDTSRHQASKANVHGKTKKKKDNSPINPQNKVEGEGATNPPQEVETESESESDDVEEEANNGTNEAECACVPTASGVRVGDTVVHVNDLGEEVQCKVVSVDASSNNCTVEPVKIGEATGSPDTAANGNEEKSGAKKDSPSDEKPKSDTVCWTTIVYGYFDPGQENSGKDESAPAHLRAAKALMCM